MAKKSANGRRTIVQVVKEATRRALMSDLTILGNDSGKPSGWKKLGTLQLGHSAQNFAQQYVEAGWTLEAANDDE